MFRVTVPSTAVVAMIWPSTRAYSVWPAKRVPRCSCSSSMALAVHDALGLELVDVGL